MKIVIDGRFLTVSGTGISSYVDGLVKGIIESKAFSENEYTIIVSEKYNEKINGIQYIVSKVPVVAIKQHLLMPFYLYKGKWDVYHYPHFDLPLAFNTLPVITIHDLKYIKFPELFHRRGKAKSLLMKTVMKNSIKRARKIITVSKNTKHDIVNLLGVPSRKIEVIYEASDPFYTLLSNVDRNVLSKYEIKSPFILFVGEIRPHKNVSRLIKAFNLAHIEGFELIIVGKRYRDYKDPFILVKKLGLHTCVKFLEYIPKIDLLHLYNLASLFILPSLYEGFGIPVLEAMSCGTPVITSEVSSLPEVAGDSAMLVNPYDATSISDAIEKVLNSITIQEKLKKEGLKHAKKFSWARTARDTIRVYKKTYGELKQKN